MPSAAAQARLLRSEGVRLEQWGKSLRVTID